MGIIRKGPDELAAAEEHAALTRAATAVEA